MPAKHGQSTEDMHENCSTSIQTSLRRILNIRWQDKVPDTEVLERANLPSIYTLLQKCQLRWAGHVYRMPDHRIPKQLLYGELASGKRSVGGQRKRFKDSLKTSLKAMNVDWESWESHALISSPLAPSCQHRFRKHLNSHVLLLPGRSVQPVRPGQPAPQLQSQTTSVLPVVATFVPGLAWSVISGHTETSQRRRRKSWSSSCNDGRTPYLMVLFCDPNDLKY